MMIKIFRGLLASVLTSGWGAALAFAAEDGKNSGVRFIVMFFLTFFVIGAVIAHSEIKGRKNSKIKRERG